MSDDVLTPSLPFVVNFHDALNADGAEALKAELLGAIAKLAAQSVGTLANAANLAADINPQQG